MSQEKIDINMSVREILETNNDLQSRYADAIRNFCKERMYSKSGDVEAPKIRHIMDIFFWMGKISEKQMDWVVRYATKNQITVATSDSTLNNLNQ
jgi:rRNA-processing protein FCF1